ncbi:FAD-dependent oxidoreductase [Nonomuraea lactucae]|uniref:FAD-dependent oxidoreductase n=1 Tax=Nonomuraea lactucae TaxID=2249762 RepID=UPI000DE33609|nr:hypothetical protein [Nonomuraea lactucae]
MAIVVPDRVQLAGETTDVEELGIERDNTVGETMMPSNPEADHVVVIGASMAGLLAARVLADQYGRVTVIERDELRAGELHRRGVPQSRHAHGLLARGREIMEELFPGLTAGLISKGVLSADVQAQARWYNEGLLLRQAPSDLQGLLVSRPLLEASIRDRLRALDNVRIVDRCEAVGLLTDQTGGPVTGVRVMSRIPGAEPNVTAGVIPAGLVVDASGRGGRAAVWLEELGYPAPEEERVRIDLRYTTHHYRRTPDQLNGDLGAIIGVTDDIRRNGVMLAQEGDRWIVTLGGYLGEEPPRDHAGFTAFAAGLAAPDIHDVIRTLEPVEEPVSTRFPATKRRHYARLSRFPEGYLVLGDAISSFNPVFGQGMTVASLEALELRDSLLEGPAKLAVRFFERTTGLLDAVWATVVGSDLRYPEVEGPRSEQTRHGHAFMGRLHHAAHRDPEVGRALLRVINFLDGADALQDPAFVDRVLRSSES